MPENEKPSIADLIEWLNQNSDSGRAGDYVTGYTTGVVDACVKQGVQDLEFKWELKKLSFDDGEPGAYRIRIHSFRSGNEKASSTLVLFYSVFVNGKIGDLFVKRG